MAGALKPVVHSVTAPRERDVQKKRVFQRGLLCICIHFEVTCCVFFIGKHNGQVC